MTQCGTREDSVWRFDFHATVSAHIRRTFLLIETSGTTFGTRTRAGGRGRCRRGERGAILVVGAVVDLTLGIDAGPDAHGPRQGAGTRQTPGAVDASARHGAINRDNGEGQRVVEQARAAKSAARTVPPATSRSACIATCDCSTALRERRVMLSESGRRGLRASSAAVSAPVFSARGAS